VFSAGVGNVATGAAPYPDQRMRIASTAKAYSGAVALALVETGVLTLDDTVGRWLPGTPRTWANITLAQLLHHTSGIPSYLDDPAFQRRFVTAPHDPIPPSELLPYVYDTPLMFTPGTRYTYSNSDNIAVALMAEAVTNIDYVRLLQLLVFSPLDIHQTTLPKGFRLPAPSLHGYDVNARKPPEDVSELLSSSFSWASGGMVSTPFDQTRFIRGYVGRKLFSAQVQAEQFAWIAGGSSEPPGPGANSAGLAIFRYATRCGTVYGHTGNYPGYTQLMVSTRSGDRSLTVSVNRQLSATVAPRVLRLLRYAEELGVCALVE
jgi:D-alanyl-D-alanine carboxypeptidase